MFTYELARRLQGTGVTATVCHPGVVRTSFGAEDQVAHMAGMIRVARLFMKTPAQGAATPVYLASSSEAAGITGRYYANRKPKTSRSCRSGSWRRRPGQPRSAGRHGLVPVGGHAGPLDPAVGAGGTHLPGPASGRGVGRRAITWPASQTAAAMD
jgi:hypothetical protein